MANPNEHVIGGTVKHVASSNKTHTVKLNKYSIGTSPETLKVEERESRISRKSTSAPCSVLINCIETSHSNGTQDTDRARGRDTCASCCTVVGFVGQPGRIY